MTASLREAAQMALDALINTVEDSREAVNTYIGSYGELHRPKRLAALRKTVEDGYRAARALEAALAAPEAEPVAWRVSFNEGKSWTVYEFDFKPVESATIVPLYTAPQPAPMERQPLTDEEISMLWWNDQKHFDAMQLARAVEKHHGIKAAA